MIYPGIIIASHLITPAVVDVNFEIVSLQDRQALGLKEFALNLQFHLHLLSESVGAEAGEEVACHELVDAALVAAQAVAGLQRMDRRVGLVCLLAVVRVRSGFQNTSGEVCRGSERLELLRQAMRPLLAEVLCDSQHEAF